MIEARIVDAERHVQPPTSASASASRRARRCNRRYSIGTGGSLSTTPVVSLSGGTGGTVTRETRTQTPFELASGIATPGYSDSPQLNVNLPVANAAGQLALTLINLGSGNLINLELSALEADNRGKVVSSPRVITGDNQKAHIEQGTEIPYVTPGSANSPATVSFKKGGAGARRHAADHAGRPRHHAGRDPQGFGGPERAGAGRRHGALDRHEERA